MPKVPNRVRWMWDEEGSVGRIGLRWQAGTDTPPDHVRGHIGSAAVPWKRNRGYAKVRLGADIGGGLRAGEAVNPRFGSEPKLLLSSTWRRCQHRQPTCGKTG
jgi:hypothetical protein